MDTTTPALRQHVLLGRGPRPRAPLGVAQIIIVLGLITTLRTLREGMRFCLRRLGVQISRAPADPPAPA